MELGSEEKEIMKVLLDYASKYKKTISYQQLSNLANLPLDMGIPEHRVLIGEFLGNVSKHEFQAQRPLLSAIVVTNGKYEGDGFYKLCEELGFGDWQKLKRNKKFTQDRINECFEYYSKLNRSSCGLSAI